MSIFDIKAAGNAEFAGVDNAGVDKSARYGKGGHCGSGQCGTIVARVDNAGVKNVSKLA